MRPYRVIITILDLLKLCAHASWVSNINIIIIFIREREKGKEKVLNNIHFLLCLCQVIANLLAFKYKTRKKKQQIS
jgi:hypothetical protein